MAKRFQQKFYNILKNIFVGAEVKGKGGYVNLMRIKHLYYRQFERQFNQLIEQELLGLAGNSQVVREEFYGKLYTFFNKYFSESGSIYFANTAFHEKVFEQIYTNDKDVMLFWKTKDLYYVKTEKLYRDLEIEVQQDDWTSFDFFISVAELTLKKANEKKAIIFHFERIDAANKRIVLAADYAANGKKTNLKNIHKLVKKTHPKITTETFEKAFAIFNRQTEVDYFIHKNAKGFLEQQFLHWYKAYLLDDDSDFDVNRLNQLKALRRVAFKLIGLVAQFEDELVKIWNKPKFVRNSNYVITLDKIAEHNPNFIQTILTHDSLPQQIEEWQQLGMVDDNFKPKYITQTTQLDFSKSGLNEQFQHLPIDTQYFKNIEFDLLALFDNLDEALDGWLIHSENYQALNTIAPKFQQKVQAIYIDPPYNAKSSEIIYINEYKHASFASFLENRLALTKKILSNDGFLMVAMDDYEYKNLYHLTEDIYGAKNFIANIVVVHNPRGRNDDKFFGTAHEYMLTFAKDRAKASLGYFELTDADKKQFNKKDEISKYAETSFMRTGNNSDRHTRPNLFYSIYYNKNTDQLSLTQGNDSDLELLPINDSNEEKTWRWGKDTFLDKKDTELFVKKVKNNYRVFKKRRIDYKGKKAKTIWHNSRYDASSSGIGIMKNLFGREVPFDYPKSLYTVLDAVKLTCKKGNIALDFFAGSGTTAHAVMELNKDGGKRKFILVEMGEHFNKVVLPRVKKVAYSYNWKNGKAQDGKGHGGFFKYYTLEQYEEALSKTVYTDKAPVKNRDIFKQYMFLKDDKMNAALELKATTVKVSLEQLYPNIDIAETLSNLYGKAIKRLTKTAVTFADDSVIDLEDLDYKHIKPLIWW